MTLFSFFTENKSNFVWNNILSIWLINACVTTSSTQSNVFLEEKYLQSWNLVILHSVACREENCLNLLSDRKMNKCNKANLSPRLCKHSMSFLLIRIIFVMKMMFSRSLSEKWNVLFGTARILIRTKIENY